MFQSLGGRQEGSITRERAVLESPVEFFTGFVNSEIMRMKIGAGNLRQATDIPAESSQNLGFVP